MKLRRRVTAAALDQKRCQLLRVSDVPLNNDYFPSRGPARVIFLC